MKCEILRNGQVIAGATEYDAAKVREIITHNGGDFRLVPSRLSSAIKLGSLEIKPVREVKPSLTRMEQYTAPTREDKGGEIVYTYGKKAKSPEAVRRELKRKLAEIHDKHDSGRLVHRGVSIKSDLEARINASGTLDEFKKGTLTQTQWRGREIIEDPMDDLMGGGTSLGGVAKIPVTTVDEMQAVYDAIFGHLSKGFSAKETVEVALDALTDADLATYNVKKEFDALVNA